MLVDGGLQYLHGYGIYYCPKPTAQHPTPKFIRILTEEQMRSRDNSPEANGGQVPPLHVMVSRALPPIMNTGNQGPMESQPFDWVCQTCNYCVG